MRSLRWRPVPGIRLRKGCSQSSNGPADARTKTVRWFEGSFHRSKNLFEPGTVRTSEREPVEPAELPNPRTRRTDTNHHILAGPEESHATWCAPRVRRRA